MEHSESSEKSQKAKQAGLSGLPDGLPSPLGLPAKPGLFESTAGFKLVEQILDRSDHGAPELEAPTPRTIEIKGDLGHSHGVSKPLLIVLVGVLCVFGYLCILTWTTYHELPISSLLLIGGGLGLFGFALVNRSPTGCDCKWQTQLIKSGAVVQGQVTELRSSKSDNGEWTYEVDYAFQPAGSEESHWGRMKLSEQQFKSLHEGDDVTVVYTQRKDDFVSRLYRYCQFRAAKPITP